MTPTHTTERLLSPGILAMLRAHAIDGAAWSREDCHLGAGVRFDAAAIIGGELHGYEVKSEADSLSRLTRAVPSQVESYGCVCDRVTLVAAPKHITKALAIIPAWWGVLRVTPDGLVRVRVSERNPSDARVRLARLLWVTEGRPLLRQHGVGRGAVHKHEVAAALALGVGPRGGRWPSRHVGAHRREVGRAAGGVASGHDPAPARPARDVV